MPCFLVPEAKLEYFDLSEAFQVLIKDAENIR